MEAFIAGLIAAALSPVRTLVQAVGDRLSAIYHNFTDTLGRARNGFMAWVGRGANWALSGVRHAVVVATAFRWLVLVAIPRWIGQRVDQLAGWTLDQLSGLRSWAQGAVARAIDWTADRVRELVTALTDLRTWTAGKLAQLVAEAKIVRDRVFGVLGTPERLVAWILAALIEALVAYAVDNAERIAERAWVSRDRTMARTLAVTEQFIDRVF